MASLGTHIPKEITEYKEKIVGGLTLRQLAAGSVAILTGGLTFLLCHMVFGLSSEQSSYFIMVAAALPAAVGFLRPQNMDFEQYLLMRYRHWLRSKPIPYKTTSTRGESTNGTVSRKEKKKLSEWVCPYYRYDRRKERRIIRQTRKNIRKTRREIRKAQKAFQKQHRL